MKSVVSAIEKGRGVVAVAGSVLRDPEVMLALTERQALPSIALSGPVSGPVQEILPDAVARAVGQPGGVVVAVDPQNEDMPGLQKLGELLRNGPHKPTVVVAAKQYNAFAMMGALRGLKVEHWKVRSNQLFRELPHPPPADEVPAPEIQAAPKAKKKASSVRFVFAGREEEVASLAAILGEGGPVVVSGPKGVGRTQLVEHAIHAAGLERLPDYALAYGSGFDGLVNLLATACAEAGQTGLLDAVTAHASPPRVVAAAIESLKAADGLAGKALVVHDLQMATGRDGDFFRKSRLELLLRAMLGNTYPLRVVFVSTHQPVLHRESENRALRRVEVKGLKGRFLHEIFEAMDAPEFPRERFGPISERIHGHPLAARTYAVAVRDRKDGTALTEDATFLAAEDAADLAKLKKTLRKMVDKTKGPVRNVLEALAHLRVPVDGAFLADLEIPRKIRSELLRLGLLDMVGTVESKRYRVHSLVRSGLPRRATADFDTFRLLARTFGAQASKASGVERVALSHWSVWAAELGRDGRAAFRGDLVDDDAFLESILGLIRRKEPKLDLAEKLVGQALSRNPSNADAHLLRIEILERRDAKNDEIVAAMDEAMDKAPVPEVFHQAVTFWLRRRARPKAIAVLEQAIGVLPDESRLKARLASLLLRQGRRPEAIDLLESAMAQDPMLPDAYGLLGMAKLDEGVEAFDAAEELLREAVRLAPNDEVQVSRLVTLLMDRARIAELEERDRLWEEAQQLLDERLVGEDKSPQVLLLLASLVRQRGGDLERARWLVGQANKKTDRRSERRHRIRLERALIDLAEGKLDDAEAALRDLADKDPSNHRVFAGLAQVLVARGLLVPAHAEYMRARERTSKTSVARLEYETELARLQAMIETQAAALAAGAVASVDGASPLADQPMVGSGARVIRRRKADEEAPEDGPSEDVANQAAAPEGAPAVEAAAPEGTPAAEVPAEDPEAPAPGGEA